MQNVILHSSPIPHLKEMSSLGLYIASKNHTLITSKTLRSYLEPPFGNYSDYRQNGGQPYNAISHMDCYQKCLGYQSIELLGCVPLFIAEMIHERDTEFLDTKHCLLEDFKIFTEEGDKHLKRKCLKLCPIDCLTVDYNTNIQMTDTNIGNDFGIKKI